MVDIISKLKNAGTLTHLWDFQAGMITDLITGTVGTLSSGVTLNKEGMNCGYGNGGLDTNQTLSLGSGSFAYGGVFKLGEYSDTTQHIMGVYGSAAAIPRHGLKTSSGVFNAFLVDSDSQSVNPTYTGSNVLDSKWHALFLVVNRTTDIAYVYIDGVPYGTGTSVSALTGDFDTDTGEFSIGYVSSYGIVGSVKNACLIQGYAPTHTEIAQLSAQLLNSKYPTKPTGKSLADTTVSNDSTLTAGWNMIPVNNKIEDESGNGYYAIIYKATHEKDPVIGDTLKMEGSGHYAGINGLNKTDFNNKSWTISVLAKPSASGELALFGTTASTPRLYFTTNYISYDDSNVATFNNTGTAGVPHLWVATYNKDTEELKTYLDGELEDTQSHAVETGFTSLALNIGTGGASTFTGNMGAVKVYLDTVKSADWVATEYNKVKNTAVTFKTDWGVQEIPATNCVEDKFLSNTPFQCSASSGSHKITTETINGQQCKVIECTSSGHLYIPSQKMASNSTEAAYGEWEFWLYYNGSADSQGFYFINSNKLAYPNTLNSYTLYLSTTYTDARILRVNGASSSTLISGGTIITGWNKIRITRDSSGVWKLWLNDTYIGTVTDNTYTTSTYFVAMMQTGNKFAYADKSGGHSIIKRPLP